MKVFAGKRIPLKEDQFTGSVDAQFYNEHARRFMGAVFHRFALRAAGLVISGNRVLDIGTGSGLAAIEMAGARPDWRITGIDVSENMLELARRNAGQNGLGDRTDFRQATAEALPFPDGCFDLVVSNASLHLWNSPLKVFNEIARVIAPGGHVLIWDNLRIGRFGPLLGLVGRVMGMNRVQRWLWIKAIRSSYTSGEAAALLRASALIDARVRVYPLLFELTIEWRKRQE
jgi:ubiquinone/menaquinone biosynthesis C-methylase UbiE